MFNPHDEVEVTRRGDPNDGRMGQVKSRLPGLPLPGLPPGPNWYEVAFEDGTERGQYHEGELTRVAPVPSVGML